jgi:hypothetical protein
VALASLVSITFAFGAHSDSPEDSGDRKLAREIGALKRELQAIKARFPDVEANVLQTRDALDEFREEFEAFRTRLGLALDTGSPQLRIRVEKQRHGRDGLDVSVTGSVSSQAEPLSPAGQKQIGKADELLRMGDVATARLFLGHSLRGGNPLAAYKLAETYDPKRLSAWKVVGIRGDPQKARELYQQALSGGIQQARERLADLP